MNIPYVFPVRGATVPNLDFIPVQFKTVTSGDPTITRGGLIYSLTRGGAGIYQLTLNGAWTSLLVGGASVVNLGADASMDCGVNVTAITASAGRTVIDMLVTVTQASASNSDGAGNLEVHLLFVGLQQGAN